MRAEGESSFGAICSGRFRLFASTSELKVENKVQHADRFDLTNEMDFGTSV
jgi:hypothetical protein